MRSPGHRRFHRDDVRQLDQLGLRPTYRVLHAASGSKKGQAKRQASHLFASRHLDHGGSKFHQHGSVNRVRAAVSRKEGVLGPESFIHNDESTSLGNDTTSASNQSAEATVVPAVHFQHQRDSVQDDGASPDTMASPLEMQPNGEDQVGKRKEKEIEDKLRDIETMQKTIKQTLDNTTQSLNEIQQLKTDLEEKVKNVDKKQKEMEGTKQKLKAAVSKIADVGKDLLDREEELKQSSQDTIQEVPLALAVTITHVHTNTRAHFLHWV